MLQVFIFLISICCNCDNKLDKFLSTVRRTDSIVVITEDYKQVLGQLINIYVKHVFFKNYSAKIFVN